MTDDSTMTTAEALGSYYRELVQHGVPSDLAEDLVRDAGRNQHVLDGGIVLSREQVAAR